MKRSPTALVLTLCSTLAFAQTERVSVSSLGVQGNLDSAFAGGFSADGQRVAFVSAANNLVANDTNGLQDVFVRDRTTGLTVRVNVDSFGVQANQGSGAPSLSADGRFVAFSSRATNLVPGDANGQEDIFVKELASGVTTLVSRSSLGALGDGPSRAPSISGDGRYVAFTSRATNLVPGDSNAAWDVFVHDRPTATTVRVSVDSLGNQSDGESNQPSISAGGGCVSFTSVATNLVAGDTNGNPDIFVHQLSNGRTECASVNLAGAPALFGALRSFLSADGSHVSFDSGSDDLVAGDFNSMTDVFVRDRRSGVTTRVSVDSFGAEADDICSAGPLSGDNRFVTFTSLATNLVSGDNNLKQDAFVHDRATGLTTCVSVDTLGAQGNNASSSGALSGDGRLTVFTSYASNLVGGDTNGAQDVFVLDRGPIAPAPPASFCTSGTSTSGCVPLISASQQPSLSLAHSCTISVQGLEGQKSGLVFYGVDNQCFMPSAWGSGPSYLCVKAPLQRTTLQTSGGAAGACDGALLLDWNQYQSTHPAALGQPWSVGARVFAQAWYRDPPASKTTNLSAALELTYVP